MRIKQLLPIISALVLMAPSSAAFAAETGTLSVWRLYNANSGEHFYTTSGTECDGLVSVGWRYEGVGWVAPTSSSAPVYRLYSGTDHHYTTSGVERDELQEKGWRYEGVSWYSDDGRTVAILRQFNPNVDPSARRGNSGSHNYTAASSERDYLVGQGWRDEGIGWYAVDGGVPYAGDGAIMGQSNASVGSMVAYYGSKHKNYPSAAFSQGGAASIEDFARLVAEESAAEGVRAEVVFCQAMLETAWLQYGGKVDVSQYNMAGIKTYDGRSFSTFPDVRTGIRAQVQHLKAYATTQALRNPCVDPRFSLVSRGVAPTVSDLSGRWAESDYGPKVLALMAGLARY